MTLYNPYRHSGLSVYPRPVVRVKKKGSVPYMYCSSEYGNLKTPAMMPKDFGLAQAGRICHNYKNKRKNGRNL